MPFWTIDESGNPAYVNEDGSLSYPSAGAPPGAGGATGVDPFAAETLDPYAGADPAAVSPFMRGGPVSGVGDSGAPLDPYGTPVGPTDLAPGQSTSRSYSYSGYNPEEKQAARGSLDKAYAAEEAGGAATYNALGQPIVDTARQRQDAIAPPGIQAPSLLEAELGKLFGTADANRKMADIQMGYMREEQRAAQQSAFIVEKAKADYYNQVLQFQALEVNPNQLWEGMSTEGRGVALGALFISDFLGTKGIKTSAVDTLNSAIDRNIQAQITNINKQGQVAGMFGNLYEMARQQSASDAETRLRLRGFHWAAAEKEILAELAKYDAPVAMAKAVEARMVIQDQLNRDMMQLDQIVHARVEQAKQRHLEQYKVDVNASLQREAWAREDAQRQREADALADQLPKDLLDAGLWDPEQGKYGGYIIGNERERDYTRKAVTGMQDMQVLAKEVQEIEQRTDPLYNGPLGRLTQDAAETLKRSMYSRYISAKIKLMSGLAATDIERGFIERQMPEDRWLAEDPSLAIHAEIKNNHSGVQSLLKTRVLSPEDLVKQGFLSPTQYSKLMNIRSGGGGYGIMPTSVAMNDQANNELSGDNKPQQTAAAGAIKGAMAPGTGGLVDVAEDDPHFTAEDQEEAVQLGLAQKGPSKGAWGKGGSGVRVPKWLPELDYAVDQATAHPDQLEDAIKKLGAIATGYEATTVEQVIANLAEENKILGDSEQAGYADYVLQRKLLPAWKATQPASTPE